jgi:hypothetical protein
MRHILNISSTLKWPNMPVHYSMVTIALPRFNDFSFWAFWAVSAERYLFVRGITILFALRESCDVFLTLLFLLAASLCDCTLQRLQLKLRPDDSAAIFWSCWDLQRHTQAEPRIFTSRRHYRWSCISDSARLCSQSKEINTECHVGLRAFGWNSTETCLSVEYLGRNKQSDACESASVDHQYVYNRGGGRRACT